MFRVGLTGGIASGKSIVAELFENLKAHIIDADVISHQLTTPGEKTYTDIIKHFGNLIKHADGALNRAKLAEIIFQDVRQRKWLEELLHPAIAAKVDTQIKSYYKYQSPPVPYVLLVVPLLVESQWQDKVDRICVVDATPEQQKRRLAENRSLTATAIDNVLSVQADRELRLKYADDIIDNRGDISQLKIQVQKLDALYRQFALGGR